MPFHIAHDYRTPYCALGAKTYRFSFTDRQPTSEAL
jgi:hypothetical protein